MILDTLAHNKKPMRWNELLKLVPMSKKTLADRLLDLVEDEYVERIVDTTTYPPSVFYSLTPKAFQII